ncbi:3'(2'),5'-bisphosphate nucleotidase CysQ [Alkalinema sp. FACHB-956]|uniref:3'(2'),5'-bisphosphate nucleotidase CysQ family protein n=1 Tax=Alkalinema sp. FACHB-956 TaxID=2692768 RepID=UPI0016863881|nr:3'(2'),5'-bisphosphate nucleotidase CysQ [Alkalinema sp. FACHB-956]MBD2325512.1 3'(2'),5'-bisphosphate nucleotidase CysQ [Alkalinema sp. FACHB-956]
MAIAERLGEFRNLARTVGWQAADILLQARSGGFEVKGTSESPVTSADLAANQHILTMLQFQLGLDDFAYLSEETFKTQDPKERLGKDWVWVIDPLDGTKDYINNTGEYAVQIALTHQGRPVVAVVACPAMGKLYSAIAGKGTLVEQQGGKPKSAKVSRKKTIEEMILVTSRSHRSPSLEALLKQLTVASQVSIGSVGCKIAAIVDQTADLYISLSGHSAPKDWDFAAPELILQEAGGLLTRFDQSVLRYNQADVSQWGGLVGSNGQAHRILCQQLQTAFAELDRGQN